MEKVLYQIQQLLLEGSVTVAFVFVLFFVLNRLLFRPISKVLDERERMTSGALAEAAEQARQAETKTEEFESSLHQVRQEIYRRREALREENQAERDSILSEARQRAQAALRAGKADVAKHVDSAKSTLGAESKALAQQISDAVLEVSR